MPTTRAINLTTVNSHDSLCKSVAFDMSVMPLTYVITNDFDNLITPVSTYGSLNSQCADIVRDNVIPDVQKICGITYSEVTPVIDTLAIAKEYYCKGALSAGALGDSGGPGNINNVQFSSTTFSAEIDAAVRGDRAFQTFYHETGHSIGMKHTYDSDGGSYNVLMDDDIEVRFNSVMSNKDYIGASTIHTAETNGRMAGFGYLDMIWMFDEYGAGPGEGANRTYRFDPITSVYSVDGFERAARANGKVFEQLIGCTTAAALDMSGWETPQTLDLNYGGWCRLDTSDDTTLVDLLIGTPGTQYAPGNFRIWPNISSWAAPSFVTASDADQDITYPSANDDNTLDMLDAYEDCECVGEDRDWVITTLTQGVKTVTNLDFAVFNGDTMTVGELGDAPTEVPTLTLKFSA